MQVELEHLLLHKPDHFTGTVVIREWNNEKWTNLHTKNMLAVCSRYQVKRIQFLDGAYNSDFFKLLRKVVTPESFFLHDLHTIEVRSHRYSPAIEVRQIVQKS